MQNTNKDRKIFETLREVENLSGDATERFVEEVLRRRMGEHKLPPWFHGFRRTKKWSSEDMKGIDFIIETSKGDIVVDIKSSLSYAVMARRTHQEHGDHEHIVLSVNILERPEVFLGRFISAVGNVWRHRK